jgi:tRNA threonylcarbamoyladenosine biosynthesis protein TsaE
VTADPGAAAGRVLVELDVPDAEAMQFLGRRIAAALGPGDVVVLAGGLGAGKTTLAQGIGEGLAVRGPVTSPTFVIARVHPALAGGPDLVHVDAYRLGTSVEVDDLDLDADVDRAVTVVEWGEGKVEGLSPDRLVVHLHRTEGGEADEAGAGGVRHVLVTAMGDRWAGAALPAGPDGRPA